MSKQKSYIDTTVDLINKVTDRYGCRSEITENFIQAQIATNIALLADCLVEIYGSERRRKIDEEMEDGI